MNKQQIKSLTWKYFWKQKLEELMESLFCFSIGYLIIGAFIFIGTLVYSLSEEGTPLTWALILSILWVLDVLIWIIIGIKTWIQNNWERAKSNAKATAQKYDIAIRKDARKRAQKAQKARTKSRGSKE